MRRTAGIFLIFVILCGLCACTSGALLEGTWEADCFYDGGAMTELFVYLDLYEEEIALMDPEAVPYVQTVTFRADGTYTIACDIAQSTALAEEYYRNALDTFYEHREELEGCYGVSFGIMSRESFLQFYADLYGVADGEALIDMLTESTVDPEFLTAAAENGTYRVTRSRIYCLLEGDTQERYMGYTLEGDVLTLRYDEGELAYHRK